MDNKMTAEQAIQDFEEYVAASGGSDVWAMNRAYAIRQSLSAPRVPDWEIDWSKAPAGTERAIHDESIVTWLKMSPGRGVMSWRWHARAWYLHTNTEVANAMWESAIPKPEPVAPNPVCVVCDGKGVVETDNNGPIVVCPACRQDDPTAPSVAQQDQQVIADLRAEVEALIDDKQRLLEHCGALEVGIRDENHDACTESWRSLPEHLQDAVNAAAKNLDEAARQSEGGE